MSFCNSLVCPLATSICSLLGSYWLLDELVPMVVVVTALDTSRLVIFFCPIKEIEKKALRDELFRGNKEMLLCFHFNSPPLKRHAACPIQSVRCNEKRPGYDTINKY